ncbi:MAG: GHKL domain-containing protein [Lachnospiraceae bacterium]|nr:GHKL domain-containing protein [Lachnospiraceae bacterium]
MIWQKKEKTEYQILDEKYQKVLGEKAELAYELEEVKASMGQIIEQDVQIRELHESVRRIKHDMKNHMMVIAAYLNEENYEQAKAYTSEILDKLNAVHSYIETGNSLLNHILNEKLNLARALGISVKAEIENVSFAKMESLDFSALLSNILDNAIEACQKEREPELQVRISIKRGYEVILVKNMTEMSVLKNNPELHTTKESKESHGMGITQIKAIVQKYNGLCDFYEEEGWFCVSAFIPI